MFKKLNNLLKKKRRGELTVEWMLTIPITFALIVVSFMFSVFCIDYYSYSSAASNIAQEMNMGDEGYNEISSKCGSSITLVVNDWDHNSMLLPVLKGKKELTYGNGLYSTTGHDDIFRETFNQVIKAYNEDGYFNCPFATIDKIDCKVTYNGSEVTNFSNSTDTTESGDIIKTTILYRFCGIPIKVYGYSFII